MAVYDMEMVLEWAKVFPENADMGDPNGNRVAKSIADKGGQFIVQAYFTDEAQIEKLLEEGLNPSPMNSDRIIEGNSSFGIGKYMKLKRLVKDEKTFTDRNGKQFTKDYGGTPNVVDLRDGIENKRLWSFADDGPLINGTKARVQFETYSNGSGVRLLNIGVLDLAESSDYDNTNNSEWLVEG